MQGGIQAMLPEGKEQSVGIVDGVLDGVVSAERLRRGYFPAGSSSS